MRKSMIVFAALVVGLAAPGMGQAQDKANEQLQRLKPADYPTRPIEFVVAYPAGGGMDATARLLANYFQKHTGKEVIVVNKSGASGVIGESYMAMQAKPDGYNVGVMASNFWSNSHLKSDGKWSYRATEPIAFINYDPIAWMVPTDGPLGKKSLKEILALAREKPSEISVAATASTATGFLLEQVQAKAGVKFTQIPYQGGRQALTNLMGGHVDVSYGYFAEYRGLFESGKVNVLAVTSAERVPNLPDTPTFNEILGAKDIIWDAFRFAVVPKGTPADRKAWLEAAMNITLSDPELAKEFSKLGATVDRRMDSAKKVADEVHRRAELERDYLVKTGRLKPGNP